jgi:hypothetical protein
LPDGDPIYLVACFGSSLEEAHRVGESIDHSRSFWRMKDSLPPQAVERVIRFFAVGANLAGL